MDEKLNYEDHFVLSADHVNPEKASDPGLIYDITDDDFIQYLCGLGYSDENICIIFGLKVSCARMRKIIEIELNYPSILVFLNATRANITVSRTTMHVKEAASFYTVEVETPKGVGVMVNPIELKFSKV
ncbi:Subtilisin-like protease SDD1 [Platanthera zijinensis]|uniref:Subtilisin-like protease SDD1 n=1 Tax=Platanthera zijinensis TaxID=2320716 RepID=A0AAP0B9M8_9ASPA